MLSTKQLGISFQFLLSLLFISYKTPVINQIIIIFYNFFKYFEFELIFLKI